MRVLMSIAVLAVVFMSACSAGSSPSRSDADGRSSSGSQVSATAAPAKPAEAAKPAAPAAAPTSAPAAAAKPAEAAARAADAAKPAAGAAAPAPPPANAPQPAVAQQPAPPRPGQPVPPAATPVSPAQPAAVQAAQVGRMVIYVTELSMLVVDPTRAADSIGDISTQAGGYIAGVENKDDSGTPVTIVKVKVPPERYDPTMRQLRGLAVEVTSEKATTQDVTEEFNDVQTQLAALEASYNQLLELMGKAQNVDEILKIQQKLAETKTQIDRLKGRQTFLQRSSELATITVSLRPAGDVLARAYSSQKTQLRRAESQRAQLMLSLQRARTPEEEATLRDQLGDVTLQIDRFSARVAEIEREAQTAKITLPTPPPDDTTATTATTSQDVVGDYLRMRGELRAAEADRDRLTKEQRQRPTPEVSEQLRQSIVKVTTLGTQVSAAEERAKRTGIVLPSLTPDQVAALAGLPPEDNGFVAQNAGLWVVGGVVVLVIVLTTAIFSRRRRGRGTPPSAPAAPTVTPTAPAATPAS